jgi:hypothetical protein
MQLWFKRETCYPWAVFALGMIAGVLATACAYWIFDRKGIGP